jgi:hypothetical protein
MKLVNLVRTALVLIIAMPCLLWSANLTVTVTDENGGAVIGADVVAVSFSSMGPVGTQLGATNGSGIATLNGLLNNSWYTVIATTSGYVPSARDQMFNWTSGIQVLTSDVSKTIQLRHAAPADNIKDIKITVTHDAASGNLLFLNLMNKNTYEQAGMGYFKSGGAGTSVCYIYSAPTSAEDLPFQLNIFDPTTQRGNQIGVNNKPTGAAVSDAGSINISSTGGAMGPPKKQMVSDEKLGDVAVEGMAIQSTDGKGIEGVDINIHDNTDNSVNMNTQTDQNGYFSFYQSADPLNKIFQTGHNYGVNVNKQGYAGTFSQISYADVKTTMTVTMTPVNGKIKGIINIISDGVTIPIPQASINAWGDCRNYGSDEGAGSNRHSGNGNAQAQVEKGQFELTGLPVGRYTLNVWSEFNNQPIVFNNGPDQISKVDSTQWNTAGSDWGDDFIVEITTDNGYAKVFRANSPATLVVNPAYYLQASSSIVINITKNPDGLSSISGVVTFSGTSSPIDPSGVMIVAREDYSNSGTMPKSGFTVLKTADKVSDYVYKYTISGLASAMYRVEINAPGFGIKVGNGQRTNENINLQGAGAMSAVVNMTMSPSGTIEGFLRTPNGTIFVPKFDGMNNMNANVNANCDETNSYGYAQVDKNGKFRIEGLLPGKYQLRADGWGNSYVFATSEVENVNVEVNKVTSVEIPLHKGVRVNPVLSPDLPAAMKAKLNPDPLTGMENGNMYVVYTPANFALTAKNIEQVFDMAKGGNQKNNIGFWNGYFQTTSIEPGAYNFYLVYEDQFPQSADNMSKVILGKVKNFVVDPLKQTDQYAQNGSTMNMVSVQNITIPISVGDGSLTGAYSGVNTLRDEDLEVIAANFSLFISYVPRVTLVDNDGNILAVGLITPTPQVIHELGLDGGDNSNAEAIAGIKNYMNQMTYGIKYLTPQQNIKAVVTTPNYPPLVRNVSVPGTMNVNMDTDAGIGAKITGFVRNNAGTAVKGATIRIRGRLLDRIVKTRDDGTYLIPGLALGTYRLTVTAEGYALEANKVAINTVSDQGVNFALTPCAGTIQGTVYSQKFPYPLAVSGAKVVAYDDTANGLNPDKELPIYEAMTDNDGNYKISPVIEGHTFKVALVVPGKAVQVFSPSPTVGATAGSVVTGIDFTYKSIPPKVDLVARPNADGSVTLRGDSPKKLVSMAAKYTAGATYNDLSTIALTVSKIGDKTYEITLPDKTKAYAVRFTADDGASKQDLDIVYNPKNLAQIIASIEQQAVASGDIILDTQGNDNSGIYLSPGSISLADGSAPQLSIDKENRDSSDYAAAMNPANVAGDVYKINLAMDGSAQNENKTMTLTIGYDPSLVGNDIGSLSVCQFNPATGAWEPIDTMPMIDPISGTVSIEVPSIANGVAAAPVELSQARFNGKEYVIPKLASSSSNQQGIFMVSKVPNRLAYSEDTLKVFNVPNPFDLNSKTVALTKGGSLSSFVTEGTVIRFAVPSRLGNNLKARFRIYNIAGELVRELKVDEFLPGGVNGGYYYYIEWDGKNNDGSKCASGVYFCAAEVGGEKQIVKMALIK